MVTWGRCERDLPMQLENRRIVVQIPNRKREKFDSPLTPTLSPRQRVEWGVKNFSRNFSEYR
jgi:hypothetical protein